MMTMTATIMMTPKTLNTTAAATLRQSGGWSVSCCAFSLELPELTELTELTELVLAAEYGFE